MLDGELGAYLGAIVRVRDHAVPRGLRAQLREYQVKTLPGLCGPGMGGLSSSTCWEP